MQYTKVDCVRKQGAEAERDAYVVEKEKGNRK